MKYTMPYSLEVRLSKLTDGQLMNLVELGNIKGFAILGEFIQSDIDDIKIDVIKRIRKYSSEDYYLDGYAKGEYDRGLEYAIIPKCAQAILDRRETKRS